VITVDLNHHTRELERERVEIRDDATSGAWKLGREAWAAGLRINCNPFEMPYLRAAWERGHRGERA
jgi:hypothetical protein